jgi:hypothetical protein
MVAAILAALTVATLILVTPGGAAPDATLTVGSVVAAPNQQATVRVDANVTTSSLGALTVDVAFNTAASNPASCIGNPGFLCNSAYSPGTVRCGGFHAYGRTGQVPVCEVVLQYAGQQGQCFPITADIAELVRPDGTALQHQVQNGSVCTDIDADGVADGSDNCVSQANSDQKDTDGDLSGDLCDLDDDNDSLGKTRSEAVGGCVTSGAEPTFRDCIELFVGSDPLVKCASTITANDEAIDKTPGDFNDDRKINGTDVTLIKNAIKANTKGQYNKRFDLNANGRVDSTDQEIVNAFVKLTGGKACSP